jgi:hypothetical protein
MRNQTQIKADQTALVALESTIATNFATLQGNLRQASFFNDTEWSAETYLQTLADRNSPLNRGAGASTKPVWKTFGG